MATDDNVLRLSKRITDGDWREEGVQFIKFYNDTAPHVLLYNYSYILAEIRRRKRIELNDRNMHDSFYEESRAMSDEALCWWKGKLENVFIKGV